MSSRLLKRKPGLGAPITRKKAKTGHLTADDLPWKIIKNRQEAGFQSDMDGMMELEEVEGVEVVYEENTGGKVAKFKVKETSKAKKVPSEPADGNTATSSGYSISTREVAGEEAPPFDSQALLPEWHKFSLHPQLYRALHAQGFRVPTPIQSKAIPSALKGKDVVGVAQTGSGKTLAYGLPILNRLLEDATTDKRTLQSRRPVRALVLAPTRELALQVSSHLNVCLNPLTPNSSEVKTEEPDRDTLLDASHKRTSVSSKKGKGKEERAEHATKPKGPPLVSVAAIVGGMSAQKQRRILDRGVDVLVATPGRLWDLLQEDDELASQIKNLKFLVLDEADRMIEAGHFAEMDNILRLTLRQSEEDQIEVEFGSSTEDDPSEGIDGPAQDGLQTFVFSATLSKDLQRNLTKRARPKGKKRQAPASTLDDLLMRLDFRDPEPDIIDLSPEGGVVSTLKESRINCMSTDKDAFLYYFLLRYPGRTLVFVSSIDGIRRLMPLMELLEVKAFPLHSQLEQRQRLKNLDRFKSSAHSVLLATDIAARGLDIPAVDHVVHYQIPRSADVYVHRNGRTARAMRSGFSMLMCAPDERKIVRALLGNLKRNEDDIPEVSVEHYLLDKLKERIQLARQIDSAQHKIKKENHEKQWLKEAADAMEIELGSDFELSSDDERKRGPTKHQRKTASAKTAVLKAELKQLLAQPLVARGVSTRYITSGSRSIVDDVIEGTYHETMLGLRKSQAGEDVLPVKHRKPKPEQEEWTGFSIE